MTAAPAAVGRLLRYLQIIEQAVTFAAFIVLTGVVFADVVAREISGSGLYWAREVGVYANVVVTLLGLGLASAAGKHLRPRFADRWLPSAWDGWLEHIEEALMALFCAGFCYLATRLVLETFELDERSLVLRGAVGPIQAVMPVAFAVACMRHSLYAVFPALRPAERGEGAAAAGDQAAET